ncbi:hypothetical protein ACYBSK_33990 [Streptomyces sp. BYX5S]
MEQTGNRPTPPEQPTPPASEDLDWLRQDRQNPTAHPVSDADPVHYVWQLPRFRLGSRRYVGQADHALVFVTRRGAYETFRPPARPVHVRRYVAMYEVDTDPHAFQLRVPLPSRVDSFEFEATADITWRVVDPEAFVRSQERDVPGLLTRKLLPRMRNASRFHAVEASANAEQAVQSAVEDAVPAAQAGLDVTCTVRLRRDAAARSHQARLRAARHEMEAAHPEHKAAQLREAYEEDRRAKKVTFYEEHLTRSSTAALALHLTAHPDETALVMNHLNEDQRKLVDQQLRLIEQVLTSEKLESHQLEKPHDLIIERMAAILRGSPNDEADEPTSRPSPDEPPALRFRKDPEPGT